MAKGKNRKQRDSFCYELLLEIGLHKSALDMTMDDLKRAMRSDACTGAAASLAVPAVGECLDEALFSWGMPALPVHEVRP